MGESASEKTRVQLCGRLSVEVDGVQLAKGLRGKQVRLLLAYLLLNRFRPVGREELIGALWPEQPPLSQDAALRTLLSRLRSALGAEALVGRDELALELPEPVWVDLESAVAEVQRAVQALERHDFRTAWALAQVPLNIASRGLLPGSQATWLEPGRRELEDVRLEALEVIGRAGLGIGGTQLASVERAARTLIDAEPYRDSGYLLLMEALAARGNVAEGLRVFETLRALLRDELGSTPSPETIAAHERLLRPDLFPDGEDHDDGQSAGIELPAELMARAARPLVGRSRELGQLDRLWSLASGDSSPTSSHQANGAATRAGRVVFLTGDPGIGKTRLVAELARGAHDGGAIVLAGRATEETLVPYQPFLEALRHYVINAPLGELHATTREYGPELSRLVPELRRRLTGLPLPSEGAPETERYRLFEAVVGLLCAISESLPVLLVLDDLHWADRPTLLLLRHLARALDPARLLILGAYRAAEAESDWLSGALSDLRREQLITQMEIGGLSEQETAQLVRVITGEMPSSPFSRALYAETEGNPFFVEELVRHLSEAGVELPRASARELQRFGLPEGITEVVTRRLARLHFHTTEVMRVAAVIGRDFDSALLERVVSLEDEEFLVALEEALATGLILESSEDPGGYSFSHALVREALYEGMSLPRRARIHRRVGGALEASLGDAQLSALAHHFTRAAGSEDAEKAITYALQAGERATAMLAHEEAAEHYSHALELLERFHADALDRRCRLLVLLGEAQVLSGDRSAAWPAFREAAALAERLGDSESLARAAAGAARRYIQKPGVVNTELIEMLERALETTADRRTSVRVRLLARLCGALYYSDQRDRMRGISDEAMEIAHELDDPEARAYACGARRRAIWSPLLLGQRLECSTNMLTHAREAGSLELQLQAHAWLVVDLLECGDRDAVDAQIEAFTAGAEQLRQPLYRWHGMVWRGMLTLLDGRLDQAEKLALEAVAAGGPSEAVTAPQYYAIQLLSIRREQLRVGELEQEARELVRRSSRHATWGAVLATILLEAGKPKEAREQLEQLAARDFADIPRDGEWMAAMTMLADACVGLRDGRLAAPLYEQLEPFAHANVVVGLAAACLGSVARYTGALAATMGRAHEAAQHFEQALRANAALRAPALLAHTQLDYARALGSGRRAGELLDAAALTARELALPAVARGVQELRPR